jgi:hypothetical protein
MSAIQEQRARQFATCTYALRHDRVTDGAEGVFDQALTNGLAAIVAHSWPGAELDGERVRSASGLLGVIKEGGKSVGKGVFRVLHDPEGPEWVEFPFDDEPVPNFTTVDVDTLTDALTTTHAIRHARDSGKRSVTLLTEAHMEALHELDYHPALFALTDEEIDRAEQRVIYRDRVELDRAADYYRILSLEERARRDGVDYETEFAWQTKDDRCEVEICPVCANRSLVAHEFDGYLDEIGIGVCIVCSYTRTRTVAEDMATDIQLRRAVERDD